MTMAITLTHDQHLPRLLLRKNAIPDYDQWLAITRSACVPGPGFAPSSAYKRIIHIDEATYTGCFPVSGEDHNGDIMIYYDRADARTHWRRRGSERLPPLKEWVLAAVDTVTDIKRPDIPNGMNCQVCEVVAAMRVFGETADEAVWVFADELHGPRTRGDRTVAEWSPFPPHPALIWVP